MAASCDQRIQIRLRAETLTRSPSKRWERAQGRATGRSGSISVELLLNIPVWLMLLFGTVEFGSVLTQLAQVSLASRVGAEVASRSVGLGASDCVPDEVAKAVARQLAGAGIGCAKVILEHNLGGAPAALVSGTQAGTPPKTALPNMGTYVRVTVLVRWKELTPRLLEWIAPGLSAQFLAQSTTRRYQLPSREASS
jgi:Flp pilus assembly protein TadG